MHRSHRATDSPSFLSDSGNGAEQSAHRSTLCSPRSRTPAGPPGNCWGQSLQTASASSLLWPDCAQKHRYWEISGPRCPIRRPPPAAVSQLQRGWWKVLPARRLRSQIRCSSATQWGSWPYRFHNYYVLARSRLYAAFLNGKAASRVLPPDIPIVKRSGPLILADRALDVHAPWQSDSVLWGFFGSPSRVESFSAPGGLLRPERPVTVASFRTWRGWRDSVA